jgi:hypothetical protein
MADEGNDVSAMRCKVDQILSQWNEPGDRFEEDSPPDPGFEYVVSNELELSDEQGQWHFTSFSS